MWKVLPAFLVGLAVSAAVFYCFVFFTWGVMHAGWSEFGQKSYRAAMFLTPLALGSLAGWGAYRLLGAAFDAR